jgi:ferritin-like metal-binding protein YciE
MAKKVTIDFPQPATLMTSSLSLRQLLIDQLKDIYDAEQQLLVALPQMADASSGENLKQGFLDHLEETKFHVTRLEKAFTLLGVTLEEKTCLAMKGLVAEGAEAIELDANGAVRDVALIGAARRVEHYELAAYKATRAIATALDEESVADLLQQTMDEECEADKRLCTLADLVIEGAKDFTGDESNAVAKTSPRKLGKKKQK